MIHSTNHRHFGLNAQNSEKNAIKQTEKVHFWNENPLNWLQMCNLNKGQNDQLSYTDR